MVTVSVQQLCKKTGEDGDEVAHGQDKNGSCGSCTGISGEKLSYRGTKSSGQVPGYARRMETISTGEVILLVREQGGFLDWSRACSEQNPQISDKPQMIPSFFL